MKKKLIHTLIGAIGTFLSTATLALEVDVPISSVAVSTSINNDWGMHNLIDGNVNTAWSSLGLTSSGGEAWASISFRSPIYVDYVKLYPRIDTFKAAPGSQKQFIKSSGFPVDMAIQYLSGGQWVTSKTISNIPAPAPSGYVHIPISHVYTSAIRVVTNKTLVDSAGGYYFQLAEIKSGYDTDMLDQNKRGISIYGDSTTWGFAWKTSDGLKYADRIESPLANQIGALDFSIPGLLARDLVSPRNPSVISFQDSRASGVYRDEWQIKTFNTLLMKDPSYTVIIRLGLNDAFNSSEVSRIQLKQYLTELVNSAMSYGKRPVLAGLNRIVKNNVATQKWVDARDDYDNAIREVAAEKGVLFIDVGSVTFNGASDIIDDVHATPEYNQRIVQFIKDKLLQSNIRN